MEPQEVWQEGHEGGHRSGTGRESCKQSPESHENMGGAEAKPPPGAGTEAEPPPGAGTGAEPPPGAGTEAPPGAGTGAEPPPGAGTEVEPPPGAGTEAPPVAGTEVEPPPGTGTGAPPGAGTEAEAPPGTGTGMFPRPPLPVPPSTLTEIEARLVCADEEDTEFGDLASPGVAPGGHQDPARSPQGSVWDRLDPRLRQRLREGRAWYRQNRHQAAAAKFHTALELCSKGFAVGDPLESSPEEISRLASFIEAKLVLCYLKLGQPGIALGHAHRSIIQNPSHFRNHLLQAACLRSLRRCSEAARSAMVADCLYVLAGGATLGTSDLIHRYWQALIQEALSGEGSFGVLFTPLGGREDKAETARGATRTFAEEHPDYTQHIFTDPHGIHLLPEGAEPLPDQQYLLTLGFRDKELGRAVEKFVTRKLPIWPDHKTPSSPSTEEETGMFWENSGEKVMAVVDFIGSTKIKDERSPCAHALGLFQRASQLGSWQRGQEQCQVMTQAMAELATLPYLQRLSQEDDELLQSLTADALDILAGGAGDRVWTKLQKVALIEEELREGAEAFLGIQRAPTPGVGPEYSGVGNTTLFPPSP